MGFEKESGVESKHNSEDLENKIIEVIDELNKVELLDEFKNDPEQLELLEKNKSIARRKIREIWNRVNEYMNYISALERVRLEKDYLDQKEYLEKIMTADGLRKLKHDALMSSLISTVRFIATTFGKIDQRVIEKWEEDREERGLPVLKAARIELSKNVLCPDYVNLEDRVQITNWATELYRSTGNIEKRLSP